MRTTVCILVLCVYVVENMSEVLEEKEDLTVILHLQSVLVDTRRQKTLHVILHERPIFWIRQQIFGQMTICLTIYKTKTKINNTTKSIFNLDEK